MKPDSPMLTTHEVAEFFRIRPETVRRLVKNGTLHPLKVGRIRRFHRAEIESLGSR